MFVFVRNCDLFSKKLRFSCISPTENDISRMIHDNSLKTRVIPSKLVSIDGIRLTLHSESKNMWVSVSSYDFFSKNHRFSCIWPTEHDSLCMIGDNSTKTRVIPSRIVSIDSIRWTLHAERKNMCVSQRNNDLFSRNFDFRAFRQRSMTFLVWLLISLCKLLLCLPN